MKVYVKPGFVVIAETVPHNGEVTLTFFTHSPGFGRWTWGKGKIALPKNWIAV